MKRLHIHPSGPVVELDYTGQDQREQRVRHPELPTAATVTVTPDACACGVLRGSHESRGHPYTPRNP